jgi:hypothetical protein
VIEARPRPDKPKVAWWRWPAWGITLVAADIVFYVLLTPLWLGLRGLAWMAEFRARRRKA